ncbi:MAG: hypothetical protein IPG06_06575 [Haliea sp.]|nr:hypothetical protein [Haliea sp.]
MEDSGALAPHNSKSTDDLPWRLAALVLLACLLAYGVALNGPLFFDDEPARQSAGANRRHHV